MFSKKFKTPQNAFFEDHVHFIIFVSLFCSNFAGKFLDEKNHGLIYLGFVLKMIRARFTQIIRSHEKITMLVFAIKSSSSN